MTAPPKRRLPRSTLMLRRLSVSFLVALVVASPGLRAQNPPPRRNPMAKLAEPWPDDEAMAARRGEAQNRKLFQDGALIEFSLTSEFNLINKERSPNNGKQFPGVLAVGGVDIPV